MCSSLFVFGSWCVSWVTSTLSRSTVRFTKGSSFLFCVEGSGAGSYFKENNVSSFSLSFLSTSAANIVYVYLLKALELLRAGANKKTLSTYTCCNSVCSFTSMLYSADVGIMFESRMKVCFQRFFVPSLTNKSASLSLPTMRRGLTCYAMKLLHNHLHNVLDFHSVGNYIW